MGLSPSLPLCGMTHLGLRYLLTMPLYFEGHFRVFTDSEQSNVAALSLCKSNLQCVENGKQDEARQFTYNSFSFSLKNKLGKKFHTLLSNFILWVYLFFFMGCIFFFFLGRGFLKFLKAEEEHTVRHRSWVFVTTC